MEWRARVAGIRLKSAKWLASTLTGWRVAVRAGGGFGVLDDRDAVRCRKFREVRDELLTRPNVST